MRAPEAGADRSVNGKVEVVFALRETQWLVTLDLAPGMTAAEAVERSGLAARFPEISARPLVLGVYGTRVEPDRVLEPGDRVEICRPLETDPRDLRRALVADGKVMGGRTPGKAGG